MLGARPTWAGDALTDGLARAQAAIERHQWSAAEEQLRALVKLYPKSYLVHNNLGVLYLEQQRYPQACGQLAIAANLNSDAADVQRNLGTCYFVRNDYASAVAPLERSKSLNPQDLRTRYQLGYALLMLGKLDQAQPELDYAGTQMAGDEHIQFALAKLYQAKHDQKRVAAAFEKLRREHPDSVFAHILMGESYDIQEKPDEAIAEYRKALTLAPSMPRLHFDLGFLFWEQQRFEEARTEFDRELKINSGFTPVLYYLGDIALEQDRPSEAVWYFLAALQQNSACLDACMGLGKSYFRLREMTKAADAFERAERLDNSQPDVHYWLAKTYKSLGKTGRNEQELRVFQSLAKNKAAEPPAEGAARAPWPARACMPGGAPRQPVTPER
jgi:tetratricopeptide (TPR) repeat protein